MIFFIPPRSLQNEYVRRLGSLHKMRAVAASIGVKEKGIGIRTMEFSQVTYNSSLTNWVCSASSDIFPHLGVKPFYSSSSPASSFPSPVPFPKTSFGLPHSFPSA